MQKGSFFSNKFISSCGSPKADASICVGEAKTTVIRFNELSIGQYMTILSQAV